MSHTIAGLDLPQNPPKVVQDDKPILDLFSLKGKVASVTGSSGGIGLAVAEGFAQAGADIAIWYNTRNPEDKANELASKYGVKVKTYKVKVDDSDAVDAAIQDQVKEFGKIDILVANAGVVWHGGPLIDEPNNDEWNNVIDVDVNAQYFVAKAIGRVFKKQGFGSLIFTASMSGHIVNVPRPQACYNAAKAAVLHFSRSLAVEWAGFARVNTVSPGYIDTGIAPSTKEEILRMKKQMTPLGRIGLPAETVGAYLYLASDASTFTTGSDIKVDGGYTCP